MKKNFQFSIFNFQKGFTLIEIMFVIAIGAVAVGIVMISLSKLNSRQALETNAELVASVLNEARSLTLASANGEQYGVNIQDSEVVLFRGISYLAGASTNVATTLHTQVAIRNISLAGGGSSVVFKRLTGATDQDGTLEVYLKSASTTFQTIRISLTGQVEAY